MSQKSKRLKKLGKLMLLFELGIVFGMATIIILLSVTLPFSFNDSMHNIFDSTKYNAVVYSHVNDTAVMEIVDFCKAFEDKEQVDCVVAQVQDFYNYNDSYHTLNTPSQYKQSGGVCRDITIFYKAVFVNFGWYCQYIFPNFNHVYLMVSKSDKDGSIYCTIDGLRYHCVATN